MKKVLVIGSCGAGKSTFSRRLGRVSGLPVIHLDALFWNPNWVETPKDEWRAKVESALRGDRWIIDGNYSGTMDIRLPAADTIIFLDVPRTVCVYRILKRAIVYRNKNRPDMAKGCNEKIDWEFVKWTWNYPTRSKPKVEARLKDYENEKTIIRLKSKQEIENFFMSLDSNKVKSLRNN